MEILSKENPLFQESLPVFDDFRAEHILSAVQDTISLAEGVLNEVTSEPHALSPSWQKLIEPLLDVDIVLSRIWCLVSHINSVRSQDAWRQAYMESIEPITVFCAKLGQHKGLYNAMLTLKDQVEYQHYSQARKSLLEHRLRDAKLSGVDLEASLREQFILLQTQLSQFSQVFENNVLDSTDAWHLDVADEKELAGLPAIDLTAAKTAAPEGVNYRITLKPNMVQAVLTHADSRQIRQELYQAWATRASDVGPNGGKFDNSTTMVDILNGKSQEAKMLGFENYGAVSLVPKMASSTEEVIAFLERLGRRAKPFAEREKQELIEFAASHLDLKDLEPWDIGYASEALQKHHYDVSSEEVRQYFPLEKVISGLFSLCATLFKVELEPDSSISVWHQNVMAYRVFSEDKTLLGIIYFDLFSRNKKRGGAWMNNAQDRAITSRSNTIPWVFLTCNFTPPSPTQPTLLTHDEVITLFHEFGHSLHCLLTAIDVYGVSGISGVPWDAVELPSQLLEHWCWQPEIFERISEHHQTGETMPVALQKKLIQTYHFQAGMRLLKQVQFALFDMRLHCQSVPYTKESIMATLEEVRSEFSVWPAYSQQRFPHSFSHIFGGGYAAGYYSYLWAQVLASDVFAAFEEEGIFNVGVGERYLKTILSQGGAVDMEEAFIAFRGRRPDEAALFRHLGLTDGQEG